jgi:hypothetical protein
MPKSDHEKVVSSVTVKGTLYQPAYVVLGNLYAKRCYVTFQAIGPYGVVIASTRRRFPSRASARRFFDAL